MNVCVHGLLELDLDSVPDLMHFTDRLLTILLPWFFAVAPNSIGELVLSTGSFNYH